MGLPKVNPSSISKELVRDCVDKPNPTILDIGCNNGGEVRWFLDIFKSPTIYCFEPDPRAIERFKKTVGPHPNVHLTEIAISDKNGEITFFQSGGLRDEKYRNTVYEDWDGSGSIRAPKGVLIREPNIKFANQMTVKTLTLDTWCKENAVEQIDFIWMDVQGAEIDVINGGREALTKTRYLYTEYANSELYEGQYTLKQLLACLDNFEVVQRFPCDVLLKNKKM